MYVHIDEDEFEPVVTHRTCTFHELHPGERFAGCSCSWSHTTRRRDPKEVARIKAERERKRENAVLAEAELIRARRKHES